MIPVYVFDYEVWKRNVGAVEAGIAWGEDDWGLSDYWPLWFAPRAEEAK